MDETHPCALNPVDHFVIDIGSGSASTCVPAEITITAEDSSNTTLLDYTGTIDITTSTSNGTWSKTANASDAQGVLTTGALDSGVAEYQFEVAELDQGSIVLSLENSHAETLSLSIEDSDAGVITVSADIVFSENAFRVRFVDSLLDDVVVGRNHEFMIEMLREDPDTGECAIASDYQVADVKAWVSRTATDPAGAAPSVISATETQALASVAPAAPNLTLPFVSGIASFSLQTTDVGRYALSFQDDSLSYSDQPIVGGSSTFVARPFAFDLQVTGNPAATGATGGVLATAGDDFSATVRAVAWSLADDANDDGIADGHNDTNPNNNANLANNAAIASVGLEVPGEGVQLTSRLLLPVAGNDTGLETSATPPADGRQLANFSLGVGSTSTLYYAEVGIIEIEAVSLDGDYLGAGAAYTDRIQGRSGHVGRFTPAYFTFVLDAITPSCNLGGYSYMGEPFLAEYSLQAFNAQLPAAQRTQNYTGDFARWNPDGGGGSVDYGAIDVVLSTPLSSRLSGFTDVVWTNGEADVDATLTLFRTSAPDGPYSLLNLGVDMSDADAVGFISADFDLDADNDTANDHFLMGQTSVVFGRLRLEDSFGPETANLPVVFVTDYWNGVSWEHNTDDACTSILLADINYPDGSLDTLSNRVVTVGGGTTTGNYDLISGGSVFFSGGDAGQFFSAPGAGNTGSFQVDIDLTNYPWLRFDWNDDGDFTDTVLPTATFSFGSYRGHDRIIYWQEVLN
jgi:hypothetical protein